MFAGPNGSGKSTLKSHLQPVLLGVYLNPDEMEQKIRRQGYLDFADYDVTTTAEEALNFFKHSTFLASNGFLKPQGGFSLQVGGWVLPRWR
jgi:predicted ABC-type ATPase